mmetsp:Transcript_8325/g.17373  ORF Transcript_8325/g.17373 Transcript_8325/m.17373 type:complete len:241 (+) Transcript_8325:1131-1853(+)
MGHGIRPKRGIMRIERPSAIDFLEQIEYPQSQSLLLLLPPVQKIHFSRQLYLDPPQIIHGALEFLLIVHQFQRIFLLIRRIGMVDVGPDALPTQEQSALRIDDLLGILLPIPPIARPPPITGTQIQRRRPGPHLLLRQLLLQQMHPQANDVHGVIVIDVPKFGVLTPAHGEIVDEFVFDEVFFFEELEGAAELSGGEGEARGHVVVAEEFVAEENVDEADGVVVVEGAGYGGDEGFGVDG